MKKLKKLKIKQWLYLIIFISINWLFNSKGIAYDVRGAVYRPDGKPSSETNIWLVHAVQGIFKTKSDMAGNFLFQNCGFGEVSIIAKDKEQRIGGGTFVLMQDEGEIRIYLFNGVKQKLKVYNPNLTPISGAFIRRLWIGEKFCVPMEELAEQGYGWIRSNDEGEIILTNMPSNEFIRVIVAHVDYADTYLPFVPINENKNMDVILQKGTLIRGRVVKDGKGIKNATIIILQKGANNQRLFLPVKTDKEGLYRIRLDKGEYTIFATHPEYPNTVPKEISVVNMIEDEIPIDFEFKGALFLQGTIQLLDGSPCKLAKVAIREENDVEDFTFTNEKGEYLLKSSSKKAKVRVFPPPGYITESLPEIPVDFKDEQKIIMPIIYVKKLPEIKGEVKFQDGKGGDHVFIRTTNLEFPIYTITDNEGKFQILFDVMPEVNPVQFVAEHALRFVRSDFAVDLFKENKTLKVKLDSYEPKQEKFVNKENENRLIGLIDKPAPEIKCRSWFNFKGSSNPIKEMEGKVIILLFWGGFDRTPWGRKHVEEMRALFDLYKSITDVQFLSIHDGTFDDDEVQNYIKEYQIEFPVGVDSDQSDTFTNYTIELIPQSLIIDKKGIIRYTDLEGRIIELIKILRRL